MQQLKNLINGILVFIFFYLIGSFIEVSFDISKWSPDARFLIGVFGALSSAVVFLIDTIKNAEL